jgi:hypothetical protein
MLGSSVLDIALGLTFVYVMMSLMCTTANELLASLMAWRASNLAEGIRNLLKGEGSKGSLADEFYEHPLIQSLYRRDRPPSYIPSRTFALALMDILVPAGAERPTTIDGLRKAVDASRAGYEVKRTLQVLIDDAKNVLDTGQILKSAGLLDAQKLETAVNQVHENVEVWFNNSMERVAGWYKRKTQGLTLVVAGVLVVALNVDTVAIVKRLSSDSALRAVLVAQAEKLAEQPPAYIVVLQPGAGGGAAEAGASTTQPSPGEPTGAPVADTQEALSKFRTQLAGLEQTGLPLGWAPDARPRNLSDVMTKILGLLLTIGAASLGAPFWFDILNKIVTIRSAGKAPEEAQKGPKEVPKPVAPGQPAAPLPTAESPAPVRPAQPI